MLSIKSFKNIQGLRTQKMIREEIQKEDFFDHLLLKIKQEFTPTEYQFLINYVIPKKNETRNQKSPIQTNKTVTFEIKENDDVFDHYYNQTTKTNCLKSYKEIKSECSQQTQRDRKHYFIQTMNNVKRSPEFTKTTLASQCKTKYTNSLASKKTTERKFEQMSNFDKEIQYINQFSYYKLRKRSKKVLNENMLSRQNIKRTYNQKFIKSIMKTELFQDKNQKIGNFDFNHSENLGKFKNPYCDFWQKEKEKEEHFRNPTSIKFQGSPKTSRFGLRIFTRKF